MHNFKAASDVIFRIAQPNELSWSLFTKVNCLLTLGNLFEKHRLLNLWAIDKDLDLTNFSK